MDNFTKQALEEYNSEETAVHPGGVNGRPYWNVNSTQFTFNPRFLFPKIPCATGYLYTATDCTGRIHSFKSDVSTAFLTPIWAKLPTGIVSLKVEALDKNGKPQYLAGARTFFKSAPFPGRENLPPKACSYRECSIKAFRYVFEDPMTQYWLKHGVPDPEYYHNVYPSKTFSTIVGAMISFAKLEPEKAEAAMKIATNAADYLLSLTFDENSAMAGLPPTYSFKGLNVEAVNKTAPAAWKSKNKMMMIYPATVALVYFELEEATGDKKYFDAAVRIAEHYKNHVMPNGSWYLLVSAETGKAESENYCVSFQILELMNKMHKITGENVWEELEKKYFDYIVKNCLEQYNWEGQFEDTRATSNYLNLTHIDADAMIKYIAENLSDDAAMVKEAEDLMRFVEDQFVIWGEYSPLNYHYTPGESHWYSPAGVEQYFWHVPIDGSTTRIMSTFISLYSVTKNPLLLEKAYALGNMVTRMQNPENGVIPTHWMKKDCRENLDNFWINCHIGSAKNMMSLAEFDERNNK